MLSMIKIKGIYYSRRNYRVKVVRFVSDARKCWTEYVEYELVDQTFDSPPGRKFVLPMALFKLWFTEEKKLESNGLGVRAVKRTNSVGFTEVWFTVFDGSYNLPVGVLRYNDCNAAPFIEAELFEVPYLEERFAWIPLVPVHPYVRGLALEAATKWPGCDPETVARYVRDSLGVVYATPPALPTPDDDNWRDWLVEYPTGSKTKTFDYSGFEPVSPDELKRLEQLSPQAGRLFDQIRNGDYLCKWGVYEHLQATDGFSR